MKQLLFHKRLYQSNVTIFIFPTQYNSSIIITYDYKEIKMFFTRAHLFKTRPSWLFTAFFRKSERHSICVIIQVPLSKHVQLYKMMNWFLSCRDSMLTLQIYYNRTLVLTFLSFCGVCSFFFLK